MLVANKESSNFIVIAAAAFEFAPLKELLKGRFAFADEQFFELGVGVHECFEALAPILSTFNGKDILYVGTAGIFGEFRAIEVYAPRSTQWMPTCERKKISHPVRSEPRVQFDPLPAFAHLPDAHVFCSPNVSLVGETTKPEKGQIFLENLELYTCARLLIKRSASFTPILATTNAVGPDGSVDWKANFVEAATRTAEVILASVD